MKILFIGDIFAKTGVRAVQTLLPKIKQEYAIDFVIANAENTTNCKGLCKDDYKTLMIAGIDFFTMGNHTWNHEDIFYLLTNKNNIIRPANINLHHSYSQVGTGSKIVCFKNMKLRITSLIGESIKLKNIQTNPFLALQEILENGDNVDFHLVDIHAETTSEKNAIFFEFQGKVDAIVGTHTHVQTADNRIRNNTAYITDVGSTGPMDGIIGAKGQYIVDKLKNIIDKFVLEEQGGLFQFCAVLITFDDNKKLVSNIERILIYEENQNLNN